MGAEEALNLMRWHGGQGGAFGSSCQETFWREKKNMFVADDEENHSQRGENEKTNHDRHS
jgi:hypothetical protein